MEEARERKREREELFEVIRSVQRENADAEPEEVMKEILKAQQAVRHDRDSRGPAPTGQGC